MARDAGLDGLGLAFLEDSGPLLRVVHRLRSCGQAVVLAECAPKWRPLAEFVLALGLLPNRSVRVLEVGSSDYGAFLRGQVAREVEREVVHLVRGIRPDSELPAVTALNFARDAIIRPGARLWVWLPSGGLGRFPVHAPDLWRFRTDTLDLRSPVIADVTVPTPIPGLRARWSWTREAEEPGSGEPVGTE